MLINVDEMVSDSYDVWGKYNIISLKLHYLKYICRNFIFSRYFLKSALNKTFFNRTIPSRLPNPPKGHKHRPARGPRSWARGASAAPRRGSGARAPPARPLSERFVARAFTTREGGHFSKQPIYLPFVSAKFYKRCLFLSNVLKIVCKMHVNYLGCSANPANFFFQIRRRITDFDFTEIYKSDNFTDNSPYHSAKKLHMLRVWSDARPC